MEVSAQQSTESFIRTALPVHGVKLVIETGSKENVLRHLTILFNRPAKPEAYWSGIS